MLTMDVKTLDELKKHNQELYQCIMKYGMGWKLLKKMDCPLDDLDEKKRLAFQYYKCNKNLLGETIIWDVEIENYCKELNKIKK
jgi:hypothetical protein